MLNEVPSYSPCLVQIPSVLLVLPASSRADFSVACFSFFLDGLLSLLPHVLTVINLTGINEIYVANTLCETKMLHSSQRCQIYAAKHNVYYLKNPRNMSDQALAL